jgi:hypothetical protein
MNGQGAGSGVVPRPAPPQYCPAHGAELSDSTVVYTLIGQLADTEGVNHPYYAMSCPYCGEGLGNTMPGYAVGSLGSNMSQKK